MGHTRRLGWWNEEKWGEFARYGRKGRSGRREKWGGGGGLRENRQCLQLLQIPQLPFALFSREPNKKMALLLVIGLWRVEGWGAALIRHVGWALAAVYLPHLKFGDIACSCALPNACQRVHLPMFRQQILRHHLYGTKWQEVPGGGGRRVRCTGEEVPWRGPGGGGFLPTMDTQWQVR